MFRKKKEPILKYRSKIVEVPKVKCELFFVGRNGELENYIESYIGHAYYDYLNSYTIATIEDVIVNITHDSDLAKNTFRLFLENNNLQMNLEYYTLTKIVIKDVKQVEIEIQEPYYEEE